MQVVSLAILQVGGTRFTCEEESAPLFFVSVAFVSIRQQESGYPGNLQASTDFESDSDL